jgi:competence protein ComEC
MAMPLLWLSAAFVLGISVGFQLNLAWWFCLLVASIFILFACFEKKIPWIFAKRERIKNPMLRALPASALLIAFCLGVFRVALSQQCSTPLRLDRYNETEEVEIIGTVVRPPDVRTDAVYLTIEAESVHLTESLQPQPASGKLRVRLVRSEGWAYGDRVILQGKLETPEPTQDFAYDRYLAGRRIFSLMYYPKVSKLDAGQGNILLHWIYQLRTNAYQLINDTLPQPEAGLLAGILLGIEKDISLRVQEAFQDTGTTHIIAISGFNISIVAAMMSSLTGKIFSRKWSFLLAVTAVAVYTILVGAQPPVVRAAIMGVMGLLGSQIGRRQSGVNSLGFVAALMLLENPYVIWDAGFQLSFFATLGLVLFADPMQSWVNKFFERYFKIEKARQIAKLFGEYVLYTIAAQLTTFPIILLHFGRISLSSFIANPLILPPQPFVMILGGIGVIIGLIVPLLGKAVLIFVWPLLSYSIHTVELIAQNFKGSYPLPFIQPVWVILFYLLLLSMYGMVKVGTIKEKLALVKPPAVILALLLINSVVWQAVMTRTDSYLHVTVFNVEGGPVMLVETPAGNRILVNSGFDGSQLSEMIGRRLPLLDHHLDLAIIPSTSASVSRGVSVLLNALPITEVAVSQEISQSYSGRQLISKLQSREIVAANLTVDSRWQFDENGIIEALLINEDKFVIWLTWKDYSVLWVEGELNKSQIEALPDGSTVLINGCKQCTETFEEKYSALSELCYLDDCVLETAEQTARIIYAQYSWVEFLSDGHLFWVVAH